MVMSCCEANQPRWYVFGPTSTYDVLPLSCSSCASICFSIAKPSRQEMKQYAINTATAAPSNIFFNHSLPEFRRIISC